MSGEYVAYHLRYNKFIDRQTFIDLLIRIQRFFDISKYTYIGFGGVFLEDFKLIYNIFDVKKLISIEQQEFVISRQNINKPTSDTLCFQGLSGEFITNYDSFIEDESVIVWFDYANPKQLGDQLREIESLGSILEEGDILRVTFNANSDTLYNPVYVKEENSQEEKIKREPIEIVLEKKWRKLISRLGVYGKVATNDFDCEYMRQDKYYNVIIKLYQYALSKGLRGKSKLKAIHIMNNIYKDEAHQMLTCTTLIISRDREVGFFESSNLFAWEYYTGDQMANMIAVPVISPSEKLRIDIELPNSAEEVSERLGFMLSSSKEATTTSLQNYIKYHRFYPNFTRVIL